MVDTFTKRERHDIMKSVKSKGNKSTELALIKHFKINGITGWRRSSSLIGKPDLIFRRLKVAIFVDGCFWHGCKKHCRLPDANVKYWESKIIKNIQRDAEVGISLKHMGWKVVRIWEHSLKKDNLKSLSRVINLLKSNYRMS